MDNRYFDWTTVDWADLYPRLLIIAASKLRRLRWRGERFGAIPGGKTAKDIVHDAIVKTMSGDRTWRRENSLFEHLAGVVSSDISHLVRSAENQRTLRENEKIALIADPREDPEHTAIRIRQGQQYLAYLEKKKPILRLLAEMIHFDPDVDAQELMKKLSLSSIRETESLKRALRRATTDFLKGSSDLHTGSDDAHVVSMRDRERSKSPVAEMGATNG